MTRRRRIELILGILTAVLGVAGLAVALGAPSNCHVQGTVTFCEMGGTASQASLTSGPGWPGVILATLLFIPIVLAVLGFTIGDSVSRARGSLVFLWICALLLAAATTVALLPRLMFVQPPILPNGVLFLPSVVLGVVTATLGTLAWRRTSRLTG